MENNKHIAIIGGTGMLGLPVVKEFINAGFKVTAFLKVLTSLWPTCEINLYLLML